MSETGVHISECTGRCCERFWLPFRPDSLRRAVAAIALSSRGTPGVKTFRIDLAAWAPLLRYLEPGDPGYGYWSCDGYDRTWKLCRLYEHRPHTCRDYPYTVPCKHCGGTRPPLPAPAALATPPE